MKSLIKITVMLFMLQFSAIVHAKSGYEVELIIFEDKSSRYILSEDWTFNDNLNKAIKEEATDSHDKTAVYKDPEYKVFTWENAHLAKDLEKIKNNSNFNVIISKRWRQTGLDRDQSFNISLDSRTDQTLKDTSSTIDQPPESVELTSYITGGVKLIMSRYLHFNVNLQYFRPQMNESGVYEYKSFPVVSERRMKSKEVHYIDHPMVGIIILATPYKIKTNEPDSKPLTYKTL